MQASLSQDNLDENEHSLQSKSISSEEKSEALETKSNKYKKNQKTLNISSNKNSSVEKQNNGKNQSSFESSINNMNDGEKLNPNLSNLGNLENSSQNKINSKGKLEKDNPSIGKFELAASRNNTSSKREKIEEEPKPRKENIKLSPEIFEEQLFGNASYSESHFFELIFEEEPKLVLQYIIHAILSQCSIKESVRFDMLEMFLEGAKNIFFEEHFRKDLPFLSEPGKGMIKRLRSFLQLFGNEGVNKSSFLWIQHFFAILNNNLKTKVAVLRFNSILIISNFLVGVVSVYKGFKLVEDSNSKIKNKKVKSKLIQIEDLIRHLMDKMLTRMNDENYYIRAEIADSILTMMDKYDQIILFFNYKTYLPNTLADKQNRITKIGLKMYEALSQHSNLQEETKEFLFDQLDNLVNIAFGDYKSISASSLEVLTELYQAILKDSPIWTTKIPALLLTATDPKILYLLTKFCFNLPSLKICPGFIQNMKDLQNFRRLNESRLDESFINVCIFLKSLVIDIENFEQTEAMRKIISIFMSRTCVIWNINHQCEFVLRLINQNNSVPKEDIVFYLYFTYNSIYVIKGICKKEENASNSKFIHLSKEISDSLQTNLGETLLALIDSAKSDIGILNKIFCIISLCTSDNIINNSHSKGIFDQILTKCSEYILNSDNESLVHSAAKAFSGYLFISFSFPFSTKIEAPDSVKKIETNLFETLIKKANPLLTKNTKASEGLSSLSAIKKLEIIAHSIDISKNEEIRSFIYNLLAKDTFDCNLGEDLHVDICELIAFIHWIEYKKMEIEENYETEDSLNKYLQFRNSIVDFFKMTMKSFTQIKTMHKIFCTFSIFCVTITSEYIKNKFPKLLWIPDKEFIELLSSLGILISEEIFKENDFYKNKIESKGNLYKEYFKSSQTLILFSNHYFFNEKLVAAFIGVMLSKISLGAEFSSCLETFIQDYKDEFTMIKDDKLIYYFLGIIQQTIDFVLSCISNTNEFNKIDHVMSMEKGLEAAKLSELLIQYTFPIVCNPSTFFDIQDKEDLKKFIYEIISKSSDDSNPNMCFLLRVAMQAIKELKSIISFGELKEIFNFFNEKVKSSIEIENFDFDQENIKKVQNEYSKFKIFLKNKINEKIKSANLKQIKLEPIIEINENQIELEKDKEKEKEVGEANKIEKEKEKENVKGNENVKEKENKNDNENKSKSNSKSHSESDPESESESQSESNTKKASLQNPTLES